MMVGEGGTALTEYLQYNRIIHYQQRIITLRLFTKENSLGQRMYSTLRSQKKKKTKVTIIIIKRAGHPRHHPR